MGTKGRAHAREQGLLGILGMLAVLGIVGLVLVGSGVPTQDAPVNAGGVAAAEGEGFSARVGGEPEALAHSEVRSGEDGRWEPEERASKLASLSAGAAHTSCYEVADPLDEAARQVVEEQRAQGASLMHGGYLDLLGDLWSCITWTADEVTLTFIKDVSVGDEVKCQVTQVQLLREEWEELCDS